MNKVFPYPFPERFRSRLMLHYRTNITGTSPPEKLPFRVLVLGKLTGAAARDPSHRIIPSLNKRKVGSIVFGSVGSGVDSIMAETLPWMELPDGTKGTVNLRSEYNFVGTVDATLRGALPSGGLEPNGAKIDFIVTDGHFESTEKQNGFIKLESKEMGHGARVPLEVKKEGENYRLAGESTVPIEINDIALGTVQSADPKKRPSRMVGLLKKFDLTSDDAEIKLVEDGSILELKFKKPQPATADHVLTFPSLSSFSPDAVVQTIPTLHRRQVVRSLLLELQSLLRNAPEFKKGMKDAISPEKRGSLKALQLWAKNNYPLLNLVPKTAAGGRTETTATATPAGATATTTPAGATATTTAAGTTATTTAAGATATTTAAGGQTEPTATTTAAGATTGASGQKDGLTDGYKALQTALITAAVPGDKVPDSEKLKTILEEIVDEKNGTTGIKYRDQEHNFPAWARVMNALAAFLINMDLLNDAGCSSIDTLNTPSDIHIRIGELIKKIDEVMKEGLDSLLHSEEFRELERNWRGIDELASCVNRDDVIIDLLDVDKEELRADFADNDSDLFSSALFRKVYIEEYDRYGGKPFATMIGLFEVTSKEDDVKWLRTMSKIAAAAHCPFVGSVGPEFFEKKTMQEVAALGDLDALLNHPKLGKWNALRDEDFAAYIGLTLPRYVQRLPWGASGEENEPGNHVGYLESVTPGDGDDKDGFLWGSSAILFAKNVIRSYEMSEWAQHIRGPKGGGICEGLNVFAYIRKDGAIKYGRDTHDIDGGKEEIQPPIEVAIPDHREYQFARNGLMALVHRKGEATATFFSAQSIKKPRDFLEDLNTKNAYLVTNLSYTYSITRIAHYVKAMMREYIGSAADATYIQRTLDSWLGGFVTTVTNPDDLTLLYYPFKATKVVVEEKPGPFGWYKATISVLPHLQFEGMDVELQLEAALGGKQ